MVQGLNVASIVGTELQGLFGWVGIELNDTLNLVDKQRIGLRLESLFQMRLEPEGVPYSHDAGWRNPGFLAHRAGVSLTGIFGFGLQYLIDHGLYFLISNAATPT